MKIRLLINNNITIIINNRSTNKRGNTQCAIHFLIFIGNGIDP